MSKYLFLDESDIELQQGVVRHWHQPVKSDAPVLEPDGALEGDFIRLLGRPVRQAAGEWWMWYSGDRDRRALMIRSEDGRKWMRPDLNLVHPAGGQPDNELDLGPDPLFKVREIIRHPGAASPERAFVGCTWHARRIRPMFSADGLRWCVANQHPGVPSGDVSSLSADPDSGRLLLTVKLGGQIGVARNAVAEYGRAVALSTSEEGMEWSEPEIIFHADHLDREAGIRLLDHHRADPALLDPGPIDPEQAWTDVYKMPVFRYADRFMGLPTLFHQTGARAHEKNPAKGNQGGLLPAYLAWSRNLKNWHRPEHRTPFIPLSPTTDTRAYDYGMIYPAAPVRRGRELWFYYTGRRDGHMDAAGRRAAQEHGKALAAIFLARLRLDGFASMRAGSEMGAVLTPPVRVDGSTLVVNAAAAGGEVRVEIRDADTGRTVPGFGMGDRLGSPTVRAPEGHLLPRQGGGFGTRFRGDPVEPGMPDEAVPIREDAVEARVSWRNGHDLSSLRDRRVRLLFALRNADLYSFGFRD